MWGHMAGIGNLGDWSDAHGELPCGLMDSLDEMGTGSNVIEAPLSNCSALALHRAPSDSLSNKMVDAGDMDYLYQVCLCVYACDCFFLHVCRKCKLDQNVPSASATVCPRPMYYSTP